MQRILRLGSVALATVAFLCVLKLRVVPVWAGEGNPTDALRKLMSSALSAAKEHDQAGLEQIARSLQIPNYETWFKATFGEQEGTRLAAAYAASMAKDEKDFPKLLQGMADSEAELLVEDARESKTSAGNFCGPTLVKSAKNLASFYSVKLDWTSSTGEAKRLGVGYFTLVDGAYRRLNCASLGLFGPIRVGGNVQHARLIKSVQPVYPVEARQAGISGTVRLHVLIAKDGTMEQLEIVSGHPLLAQAALDAVRQWTYKPTLLNGQPVEVDTTIDVIFSLNSQPSP